MTTFRWATTKLLPILVLTSMGLLGCSSKGNLPPATPLVKLDSELPAVRAWLKVNIDERNRQLPSVGIFADEEVFLWVDDHGHLHCNDPLTGKTRWVTQLQGFIGGTPGVFADRVYVVSRDGELIALDKSTGSELWRSVVSSESLVAPQVADGIVVVYSVDGTVFGISAVDGAERWRYDSKVPVISLRGNATPLIEGGRVFVGLSDGRLAALDLWSGQERWVMSLAKPRGRTELERMVDVDASPVFMDGTIYSAAYQGQVVALQPRTGRLQWSHEASTAQDIAVDDKHVYFVSDESVIYALDRQNGRVAWKQDALKWRYVTAPALYQGYLVMGDVEGYLHWLDVNTGKQMHRVWTDYYPFDAKPVVANEKIYAMSRAGIIDVLQLGDLER